MFDQNLENRLSCWARLRQQLENASDPLQIVAKFWGQAPLRSYVTHVGIDDTVLPSPWELLEVNQYDDRVLAIMIGFTIKLTQRYSASTVELKTVVDKSHKKLYNLIFVDNIYILNYQKDKVVSINEIDEELYISNSLQIALP